VRDLAIKETGSGKEEPNISRLPVRLPRIHVHKCPKEHHPVVKSGTIIIFLIKPKNTGLA